MYTVKHGFMCSECKLMVVYENMDKYKVLHLIIDLAKSIALLFLFGFAYLVFFQKMGIGIPCLFYNLSGYKCPGCGMTHALSEIWNGNYLEAWRYNALSITVLPIACIYLLYRSIRDNLNTGKEFYIWEYILLAILFIVVLLYGYIRNII